MPQARLAACCAGGDRVRFVPDAPSAPEAFCAIRSYLVTRSTGGDPFVITPSYHSRRIVLRQSPAEEDVQLFADEIGWRRRVDEPYNRDRRAVHEVAWFADPALLLRYAEDPVSRHSYVEAWATDQDKADTFAELAAERLDAWGEDELLKSFDATDPMTRAVAAIRIGLASPEQFDERFFSRIRTGMSDPDRRVREAAIYATVYAAWSQYIQILQDVERSDPDTELRQDARKALNVIGTEEP